MEINPNLNTVCKVNNLNTDYLAEFIAVLMIEKGVLPDKIRMIRTGSRRAKTAKDIEAIEIVSVPNILTEKCIEIKVNREGLFDILPENLFFNNQQSLSVPANTQQILSEIHDNRKEEEETRRFFSLFENEIDFMKIQVHLREHQFYKCSQYKNFINLFTDQWPVLKLLEPEEGWLFIHILIHIHYIRGNDERIEQALTAILQSPVKLVPMKKKYTPQQLIHIDSQRMDDIFIYNDYFTDDHHDYILQVNDIPPEKLNEYLPGKKYAIILDEAVKMLFQANLIIEKQFNMIPSESLCKINKSGHTGAFTDINAYL